MDFDLLLQRFFVVVFARRRRLLLILHNVVRKGRAGAAEEFASASFDVLTPVRVWNVLGSRDVIHQLCLQVSEVLALLLIQRVAN